MTDGMKGHKGHEDGMADGAVGGAVNGPTEDFSDAGSGRETPFAAEDFPGGLRACVEAVLMAADRPLMPADLARVLDVGPDEALEVLRELRDDYDGGASGVGADAGGAGAVVTGTRGFELRQTARGWQLCSRKAFAPVVSRFVTDGQVARLSQAALEALAIIAYKQPVTRAQVTAIRGVASDGVIRSLAMRGLVREMGVDESTRAAVLGTTDLFLETMGLGSLDDLPSLAPFLPASADEVRGDGDAGPL